MFRFKLRGPHLKGTSSQKKGTESESGIGTSNKTKSQVK